VDGLRTRRAAERVQDKTVPGLPGVIEQRLNALVKGRNRAVQAVIEQLGERILPIGVLAAMNRSRSTEVIQPTLHFGRSQSILEQLFPFYL
jgi:hypothetical protein